MAKDAGDRYRFDVEGYRPGVPVLRDARGIVSEGLRRAYEEVPPVVWLVVRRLWVTGVAGTVAQLRAQLRFKVQRDVGEDLLAMYFAENAEELEAEREGYLEQLHRASLEEEVAMGANPALERYHRIAANVAVLLDGLVGDAVEGKREITTKELSTLTRCLKDLQASDPLVTMRLAAYRGGAGKEGGGGGGVSPFHLSCGKGALADAEEAAVAGETKQFRAVLGKLREVMEGGAEAMLKKYERRSLLGFDAEKDGTRPEAETKPEEPEVGRDEQEA